MAQSPKGRLDGWPRQVHEIGTCRIFSPCKAWVLRMFGDGFYFPELVQSPGPGPYLLFLLFLSRLPGQQRSKARTSSLLSYLWYTLGSLLDPYP